MKIEPFGVEEWMNAWETRCKFNLAETCVASLTVDELMAFAGRSSTSLTDLGAMKLTYGAIKGSDKLRAAIAGLYSDFSAKDVLVTHGAIGANALVYQSLVEHGDHVVSVVPTYQQHVSIPQSLGAVVTQVPLMKHANFALDLDVLASAMKPVTKLITLTNPNNPTGALLGNDQMQRLVEIAKNFGAYVLCDEVYRGTDRAGNGTSPSIVDLYDRGISVGSMSKSFSLAGLRLGWMAAPTDVIEKALIHRDYSVISVGMIDDYLATLALGAKAKILKRSRSICRDNMAILDGWLEQEAKISWVRPASGTTALLYYDFDMKSEELCLDLLDKTGVMFTPGSALGMEGAIRIGYGCATDVLRDGLSAFSQYLAKK